MMLSGLLVPLRALVVAILGAGIAWGWYTGHRWLSFVAPLVVLAIGLLISEFGVAKLPEDPVTAARLMPWRILVPAVIAAGAAGIAIIVAAELTLPDKTAKGVPTPNSLKEIVTALSTAITAFLAAAFIDWTGDANDSRLADWISSTFQKKYTGYFAAESTGEKLVYSGYVVDGWGGAARMERAMGIAEEIRTGGSRVPPA
jgi:hypothetical protein